MMQAANLADSLVGVCDAAKAQLAAEHEARVQAESQLAATQAQLLAERERAAELNSTSERASAALRAATEAFRFLSTERAATAAQLLVAQERAVGAEEVRQQAERVQPHQCSCRRSGRCCRRGAAAGAAAHQR
jgi:hypothetical protein